MSPSARLIGYYIDNGERVVADSILLNIEDTLPTKVIIKQGFGQFDAPTQRLNFTMLIHLK